MNYARTKDAIQRACASLDGLAILDSKLAAHLPSWEAGISIHKYVTIRSSFDLQVGELVTRANAEGWLTDLLSALAQAFPRNAAIREVLRDEGGIVPADEGQASLEALLGGTTLSFGLLEARKWSVCRIDYGQRGAGTGFLIGPETILTNWHVAEDALKDPALEPTLRFRFGLFADDCPSIDYEPAKGAQSSAIMQWSPTGGIERHYVRDEPTADELDFAVIRVEPVDLNRTGARQIDLNTLGRPPADGAPLMAIQHPLCGTMQFALGKARGPNAHCSRLRHSIPTECGSSGSLVLDAALNPVALHNGRRTGGGSPHNTAVPLELVVAALRDDVKAAVLG